MQINKQKLCNCYRCLFLHQFHITYITSHFVSVYKPACYSSVHVRYFRLLQQTLHEWIRLVNCWPNLQSLQEHLYFCTQQHNSKGHTKDLPHHATKMGCWGYVVYTISYSQLLMVQNFGDLLTSTTIMKVYHTYIIITSCSNVKQLSLDNRKQTL
jgi:hypothetical protein